jgi:hypothetical protein
MIGREIFFDSAAKHSSAFLECFARQRSEAQALDVPRVLMRARSRRTKNEMHLRFEKTAVFS